MRPIQYAAEILFFLGLSVYGQQGPAGVTFEVATIRPAPPITAAMAADGKMHVGTKVDQAQVDIGYSSLADLIGAAYQVKAYQISGPDWMSDQRWDILAKIPEGALPNQVPRMLQALLAERFGLKVHRESRERWVYGLEVAKGGPKLKPSPPDDAPVPEDKPIQVATSRDGNSTVTSGGCSGITKTEMRPDGSIHIETSKMTLAMLANALSFYLDRPVADLTQLTGAYAVEFDLSGADLRNAAMKAGAGAYSQATADPSRTTELASEPTGASLIASVQKLGLQLEPRQTPIETIVVDHLERTPTAN